MVPVAHHRAAAAPVPLGSEMARGRSGSGHPFRSRTRRASSQQHAVEGVGGLIHLGCLFSATAAAHGDRGHRSSRIILQPLLSPWRCGAWGHLVEGGARQQAAAVCSRPSP